jgi:hypothetical protein
LVVYSGAALSTIDDARAFKTGALTKVPPQLTAEVISVAFRH